ncbi:hypothetical protein FCIRC_11207 [Fusarium circinatum]|uniref:Uncharacterized protein n=1 Tax=Fusarium circinatum TaxID=48490 RepID=A0A8H5WHW6_FUSCI|nr:hypothetical protein FCIRC_11207 [Fusarium circinatum]
MSETNNIRPYIMPALRDTPSSQLTLPRRPLPSSAPKRTAAHLDEETTQESPSTPPKRAARRISRGKKSGTKSRVKRDGNRKNTSPSPSISSPVTPTEYLVATHVAIIPGHGYICYAEEGPPVFVPSTMMHLHQTPVAHACPCYQLQATSIAQMQGIHIPSIGAPALGHVGGLGWNENAWGYMPGLDLGDLAQMQGNPNFNHNG